MRSPSELAAATDKKGRPLVSPLYADDPADSPPSEDWNLIKRYANLGNPVARMLSAYQNALEKQIDPDPRWLQSIKEKIPELYKKFLRSIQSTPPVAQPGSMTPQSRQ